MKLTKDVAMNLIITGATTLTTADLMTISMTYSVAKMDTIGATSMKNVFQIQNNVAQPSTVTTSISIDAVKTWTHTITPTLVIAA